MPTQLTAHNTSTSLTADRFGTVLTAHPIDVSGAMEIQWTIRSEDAFDILNEAGEFIVTDFENTPVVSLAAPRFNTVFTAHLAGTFGTGNVQEPLYDETGLALQTESSQILYTESTQSLAARTVILIAPRVGK